MDQFNLRNISLYPWAYFVAEVALTIKDNWLLSLVVDIASDHATIKKSKTGGRNG